MKMVDSISHAVMIILLQFATKLVHPVRNPVNLQNGTPWEGEFGARIFLRHWYLQCFHAIEALEPLF